MSEVDSIRELAGQLPTMLNDVKRQNILYRALGVVVLLGSAVLAILVNPTVAIVCATLTVAALWLILPSVRRRAFVDAITLQNQFGKLRLVAAVKDDLPMMLLVDANDKVRTVFGLGPNGPMLAFLDEQQNPRLIESFTADAPHLMFWDSNGATQADLSAGDHPLLNLVGNEADRSALLSPGLLLVKQDSKQVYIGADGNAAMLSCNSDNSQVTLTADQRGANVLARKGDYAFASTARTDKADIAVTDGSLMVSAQVGQQSSRLRVGTPDTNAELQSHGSSAGLMATNGQSQLAVGVTDGSADVAVTDRTGARTSMVSALGELRALTTSHPEAR